MSAVEGWYPDPAGNPGLERYWDGSVWTATTRPLGGEAAPPPPAPVAPQEAPVAPQEAPAVPDQMVQQVAHQPEEAATPSPPGPGAPPQPMSPTPGGVGGITTELLSDERFAEVQSNERVTKQNSRLLKVLLGNDVLAKQGSMVAFQGQIDFDYEGSGAAKFIKKAVSGEGVQLMRCTGQGELFLADSGYQVHIIHLAGAGITVNGRSVLAFEPSLNWDIERIKGAGMMAGGLFNTRLEGHGWVAITTDGDPVVLRTNQPTFADTDAAVAWSSSLTTSLNRTVKAQALIGRGSGEAVQLTFQGDGIVIVQPSEGGTVPPHTH